jgi:hypothetical protein
VKKTQGYRQEKRMSVSEGNSFLGFIKTTVILIAYTKISLKQSMSFLPRFMTAIFVLLV